MEEIEGETDNLKLLSSVLAMAKFPKYEVEQEKKWL